MKLKKLFEVLIVEEGHTLRINNKLITTNYNPAFDGLKVQPYEDKEIIGIKIHHKTIDIETE